MTALVERAAPPDASFIAVRGLDKSFGPQRIYDRFDLDIERRVYELSGGQQQLVAILRALAAEPEVLFLDEPFSALDYELTLYIRDKLQTVFLETQLTTVLVSHDLEEAVDLADRILLLSKRPTRILETIAYETSRPRTPEIMASAEFVRTKQHALDLFWAEMQR